MQKRYKVILSVILLVTFSIVGANIAWMNTSQPGSSDNPLVSKGYLDNVLGEQQQKYNELHSQYKELENELADLKNVVNQLSQSPTEPNQPSQPSQPTPPAPTTNSKATIVVDASTVNFRSGNNTSSNILTQVKRGDEITALKYEDEWVQGFVNNQTGWIASWLVKSKSGHNIAYIHNSLVNVRSGAGTNHPIVTQLKRGDIVRILSTQNDWAKVVLSDGKEAWIYRSLLQTF